MNNLVIQFNSRKCFQFWMEQVFGWTLSAQCKCQFYDDFGIVSKSLWGESTTHNLLNYLTNYFSISNVPEMFPKESMNYCDSEMVAVCAIN